MRNPPVLLVLAPIESVAPAQWAVRAFYCTLSDRLLIREAGLFGRTPEHLLIGPGRKRRLRPLQEGDSDPWPCGTLTGIFQSV